MSTILVGVDDSERSQDAIAFARELARMTDAHVVAASAFSYDDRPSRAANRRFRDALQDDAEAMLRRMAAPLDELGPERVSLRTVASTSPARALHGLAESANAALVVVGSSRTGSLGRVLPGSTGERLLQGSPCAVAVVPLGYRDAVRELRRVGAAVDGSDESAAAVRAAAVIARATRGELTVIAVQPDIVPVPAVPMTADAYTALVESTAQSARDALDRAVAAAEDVHATSVLREGDPVRELEAASADLDLLVTGSRGYGPVRSVLLGGVTGRLVRVAHTPVIVVPRGVEAPLDDLLPAAERATG